MTFKKWLFLVTEQLKSAARYRDKYPDVSETGGERDLKIALAAIEYLSDYDEFNRSDLDLDAIVERGMET